MKSLRSKLAVLSILIVLSVASALAVGAGYNRPGNPFGNNQAGNFVFSAPNQSDQTLTDIDNLIEKGKLRSEDKIFEEFNTKDKREWAKAGLLAENEGKKPLQSTELPSLIDKSIWGLVKKHIKDNNILTLEEVKAGRADHVRRKFRKGRGLDVSDMVARGIAGENWEAIAELRSDSIMQAVGNVAVYKGAEVFGKHLSQSIELSVGDWLDAIFGGTLGLLTRKIFDTFRRVRNQLTGRTGLPFTGRELKLWRESTARVLSDLERLSKNASIMDARSRDKVLRDVEDDEEDEEPVDPAWAGQRSSFGREFQFIANSIVKRRSYYDPEHDEAVVFYAEQVENLLHDVKDSILHKVRSHRDLGSSTVQSSLSVSRNALDLYFYNLISLVAPRAAGERESTDANMGNMQPGMQNYQSSFGGYGNTF